MTEWRIRCRTGVFEAGTVTLPPTVERAGYENRALMMIRMEVC